jgi:hypothetical protein
MVDEEQAPEKLGPIPGEESPRLELDYSQRLIALGFDPLATVYIVEGGFNQSMISDAVFEGSRSHPRTIPFTYKCGESGDRSSVVLPMEVELIQVVWVPYAGDDGNRYVDDLPEWYIRGWLPQCELNPDGDPVRMHAYIGTLDQEGCPSTAYLQMLREQPARSPTFSLDGRLLVGDRSGPPRIT